MITSVPQPPAPTRRRRRFLPRLLVGFVLICVLTEALLRMVLGLGHPLLYRADAACGYLPAPNQKIHRFFCDNEINSDSMRSTPVQRPKPPGEFRVLFVGDSVTYGTTHVDQSKIFTSILASDLPRQLHKPVEVLNASAGGWAVGNEVGFLRSRGTFDADVVVFVLNTMDMTQPFNDSHPSHDHLILPDRNPPLAIGELWSRYVRPRLFHVAVADAGSATVSSGTEQDLAACTRTVEWLDEAHAICQRAGAAFAVVYSPITGPNRRAPDYTQPWTDVLTRWSATSNVPVLDLTVAFATAPAQEVYQDDIHLTPGGDALAAEAIERWPVISDGARRPGN